MDVEWETVADEPAAVEEAALEDAAGPSCSHAAAPDAAAAEPRACPDGAPAPPRAGHAILLCRSLCLFAAVCGIGKIRRQEAFRTACLLWAG